MLRQAASIQADKLAGETMDRNISIGTILSELVAVLSASLRDFAIFAGGLGLLTAIGVIAGVTETESASLSFGYSVDASQGAASALFELVLLVANIVGGYWLLKQLLAARGLLHTQGNRFWPYLGMSILTGLGAIVGLILVIVPGIIVLIRWSAASGYVIGAGESVTDSMSTSWRATSGHSWAIFFAAIVVFLGLIVAAGTVVTVFGALNATLGAVVSAFIESAASGIFAGFVVAIYSLVSHDTQQLSETFG